MKDEEVTMAYLERQREAIPKLRFTRAQRDELLRLNAHARALLEQLQVDNLAEAFAALAKLRGDAAPKRKTDHANAN